MQKLSYTAELIRAHDRDRYLCALFAPQAVREAWFAIFAFDYEIRSIAYKTGEEMVGFVRYAWWRETFASICDGRPPRGHPVAEALAAAVKAHALPQERLEAIIAAHEKALAEQLPQDEAFIAATETPLLELCALCVGMTEGKIEALGVAWGAMKAARLPAMDAEHRTYFTKLAQEKLSEAGRIEGVFKPFADTVAFYLKRLQKGNAAQSRTLLPLMLWWRG